MKDFEKFKCWVSFFWGGQLEKIQQYCEASNYMILTAKIFVAEKVVFSLNVKWGKVLPPAMARMVKQFQVSDKIMRFLSEQEGKNTTAAATDIVYVVWSFLEWLQDDPVTTSMNCHWL